MAECVRSVQILLSTIGKNLSEYPRQATIHGIKYLADRSRSLVERIFWIITFILSVLLFGHFVYKIGRTWMQTEFIQIERNIPTYIFEIPFPAVTICPEIKFTKQKLNLSKIRLVNEAIDYETKLFVASQICTKSFHIRTIKPIWVNNLIDTLIDMSPRFDQVCEFWQLKSFQPNIVRESFSTVITNEGVCFTFNTIHDILRKDSLHTDFKYPNITTKRDGWHPETGYTKGNAYPYKGILDSAGESGLEIILKANLTDKKQYCDNTNVGYKIALHSPSAYPQMFDNFIELDYGKQFKIEVIPKTIETSNDLRSVSPDVRQCYFNDERKLQFYTFYNQQNCHLECYANYTKLNHGGVAFSSPRDLNTTIYGLKFKNQGWIILNNLNFFHEHFKIYNYPEQWEYIRPSCNCLPECNGIYYDHKITILADTLRINNDQNETISTGTRIIFRKPTFIGLIREPRYTFETMLSDFGGLLGLFMGGSVLSLIELFYFVAIRSVFKSNVTENQT